MTPRKSVADRHSTKSSPRILKYGNKLMQLFSQSEEVSFKKRKTKELFRLIGFPYVKKHRRLHEEVGLASHQATESIYAHNPNNYISKRWLGLGIEVHSESQHPSHQQKCRAFNHPCGSCCTLTWIADTRFQIRNCALVHLLQLKSSIYTPPQCNAHCRSHDNVR